MILCNSENSINDIRHFCCPFFFHSSVVKCTYHSYNSEPVTILYYRILRKSSPHPKVTGWIRPLYRRSTLCSSRMWKLRTRHYSSKTTSNNAKWARIFRGHMTKKKQHQAARKIQRFLRRCQLRWVLSSPRFGACVRCMSFKTGPRTVGCPHFFRFWTGARLSFASVPRCMQVTSARHGRRHGQHFVMHEWFLRLLKKIQTWVCVWLALLIHSVGGQPSRVCMNRCDRVWTFVVRLGLHSSS